MQIRLLLVLRLQLWLFLVATTTYQPLMEVRLLFFGNVKLWHITAVILVIVDLMQFAYE